MKTLLKITFAFILGWSVTPAFSQCDSTAAQAEKFMDDAYISDGQAYRALLFDDQIAEFNTTFYGGAKYRIIAFSGKQKEQLQFSLYDEDNNLLFTNADHKNSPYWNFEFESTMKCRIEAQLDLSKQKSGCAVLLIGFER